MKNSFKRTNMPYSLKKKKKTSEKIHKNCNEQVIPIITKIDANIRDR